jgi:transposase-like protein
MRKPRSLLEMQKAFPDEAACAAFLFEQRWPKGFVCPRCGDGRAILLKSRAWTYQCVACRRQTSVTAGTIMHRTKLPLILWFWAAHVMATHSNGMSALQLRGQLPITYKTAWLLTQKLRRSMVDRDRKALEGVVEIDQTEIPFRDSQSFFNPNKSGKIIVIGAVEVRDRTTKEAQKPKKIGAKYLDTLSGRVRLQVIPSNAAEHIHAFVRANIKQKTTLLSDGHKSYLSLTGYRHDPRVVGNMAGHVVLLWVHRVFALLKRLQLGTYHGLRRKHADTYLNEFVFRYNRRFYRHVSFETLLGIAAKREPTSYWDITGRPNPRKGNQIIRRTRHRRKTVTGLRPDGVRATLRQALVASSQDPPAPTRIPTPTTSIN